MDETLQKLQIKIYYNETPWPDGCHNITKNKSEKIKREKMGWQ